MKITQIKTYKFNVPTHNPHRDPVTGRSISSPLKTWLFVNVTVALAMYTPPP